MKLHERRVSASSKLSKLKKPIASAVAIGLTLAILVTDAMPGYEAVPSFAATDELEQQAPESEGAPSEDQVELSEPVPEPQKSATRGAPEGDAISETESIAPFSVQSGDHWMPDPGRAYLAFEVKDTAGNHVAGSTVNVQGPRRGGTTSGNDRWNQSGTVAVVDCVTGATQCAANSLDKDSRPGYFAVDVLPGNMAISSGSGYRIGASNSAPAGYTWTTGQLTGTNESSATNRTVTGITSPEGNNNNTINNAAQGQWVPSPTPGGGSNSVNTLSGPVLQSNAPVCDINYMYGLANNGQLFQIAPNGSPSTGGTVTPMGNTTGSGEGMNGLGIAVDALNAMKVFAYSASTSNNNTTATVYEYNPVTGVWATKNRSVTFTNGHLVAGAVSPDGKTFYMGGFNANGSNRKFGLWAYDIAANTVTSKGFIDPGAGNYSTSLQNGDMAFDSAGNLYIVRGVGSAVTVFQVTPQQLASANSSSNIVPVNTWKPSNTQTDINGVAYSATGELFLGSGASISKINVSGMSGSTSYPLTPSGVFTGSVDLASCSMPPTVRLIKNLPDGRAKSGDQFGLTIRNGSNTLSNATTTGNESGVQPNHAGPVPVVSGTTISIEESFQAGVLAADYAAGYQCTVEGETTPFVQGTGTSANLTVPHMPVGKEITCEFRNTLLEATKTADPESGTAVSEGDTVTYTLKFDNSHGLGPAVVNYRDFLGDVLDDAFFVNGAGDPIDHPEVTTTGGIVYNQANHWNEAGQWLDARGTVPAGGIGTLKFPVKVYPNSHNAGDRQETTDLDGYFLRNKLVRGTPTTPPEVCEPGLCTEHPIKAWSVYKDSRPVDGARLHKGGNSHYRIVAEKLNPETVIDNLVFQDDLTHVFKTAGFAPDASVPGGALSRGIYFFDAQGNSLAPITVSDTDAQQNGTPSNPVAAFEGELGVPDPRDDIISGRWILQSEPVLVPKNAVRAEMWFAVQAADPMTIPGRWPGTPPDNIPRPGNKFTNYVTATADTDPTQCITGVTELADANVVADSNFPAECQVTHEFQDNYFTIRKDAAGPAVDRVNLKADGSVSEPAYGSDVTGVWNMVGHEFEIRDTVNGKPSTYNAAQLCRTDYTPKTGANWDGTNWIAGQPSGWDGTFNPTDLHDADTFDWGQGSETLEAILSWNNAHPDVEDQLPVCALFYPQGTWGGQPNAGGQDGRWRSENLFAGDYFLFETKAPGKQVSTNGQNQRDVPGVQLLGEPVQFSVAEGAPPHDNGHSHTGPGQLDVNANGDWSDRCEPGATVAERPTACVNPTGYLMLVKDTAPRPLPLTGGQSLLWLGGAAAGLLLLTAIAAVVWRRRQTSQFAMNTGRRADH